MPPADAVLLSLSPVVQGALGCDGRSLGFLGGLAGREPLGFLAGDLRPPCGCRDRSGVLLPAAFRVGADADVQQDVLGGEEAV